MSVVQTVFLFLLFFSAGLIGGMMITQDKILEECNQHWYMECYENDSNMVNTDWNSFFDREKLGNDNSNVKES